MTTRVGINGFGRIGRLVVRGLAQHRALGRDIELVHVNDPNADAATMAHLVEFDSVHGRFGGPVNAWDSTLSIDGQEITCAVPPLGAITTPS